MTSPLTRRGFLASASAFAATALAACGGGGVTSLVGGGGGGELPLALETDPNRRLTRVERRHFEPLVGASFRLADERTGGDGAVTVELTDLLDLAATNPDARRMGLREPFSLKLRGPEGRLAADGPYVLGHPELGDVHVFVRFGGAVDEADGEGRRTLRNAYRIHFS